MRPIIGTVIHGKGLGHTIGFPTANIACIDQQLTAGTRRYNVVHNGIIYTGLGPYFPEKNLLEVHLLDFDDDLYGNELTIYPLYKIRDNDSFAHIDILVEQINKDKQRVLTHPITVMTFGTFDHFHPGHEAYLQQAKLRGDQLITVIARDSTVKKIKQKHPEHTEEERKKQVTASGIVDVAILGDATNHYTCLLDYQPQVIFLGYDQHSFEDGIHDRYTHQGRKPPLIIRGSAHEPDRYKSSYFRQKE